MLFRSVMYLQKYGITNQMAVKIYNEYKEKMYDVISNNPYKLAEDIRGIGFRMADEIGSRVGIDFNSDFRKKCAINHILSQAGAFGHIYLPERELLEQTRELLKIHEDFSELLIEMVINRDLVKEKYLE